MKKIILQMVLVAFIAAGAVACKEKENNTDTANIDAETENVEVSAPVANFVVNAADSQIMWKGAKPLGSHNGTIDIASGTMTAEGTSITGGTVTIDMMTITDLDLEGGMKESLENHLKGTVEGKEGDFFNVNKYPTSTFEITGSSVVNGQTMVTGNLTIKEKTNEISFPATVAMDGDNLTLTSETFTIDRTKWDVNYGSKSIFDNLGDKFINDEVELTISVVATKG